MNSSTKIITLGGRQAYSGRDCAKGINNALRYQIKDKSISIKSVASVRKAQQYAIEQDLTEQDLTTIGLASTSVAGNEIKVMLNIEAIRVQAANQPKYK